MFGGFPFGQPLFGDGPDVDLTVIPPITQPEICAAINVMVGPASVGVDLAVGPASQGTDIEVFYASHAVDIGVHR